MRMHFAWAPSRLLLVPWLACAVGLLLAATLHGQETQPKTFTAPLERPAESAPAPQASEAEQFLGLQQLLETDRKRLSALLTIEREVAREFDTVSAEFNELDADLSEVAPVKESAEGEAEAAPADSRIADLQRRRNQVRERFDLVIERRKLIGRQIVTLRKKIALEREALEGLQSDDGASAGEQDDSDAKQTRTDAAPPPKQGPSLAKALGIPDPQAPAGVGVDAAESDASASTDPAYDPYVADAVRRMEELEGERRMLSRRADIVDRAIELFGKDLANVQELLRVAKEQRALEARASSANDGSGDADAATGETAEADALGIERRAAVASAITGQLAVLKASREEIVARLSAAENEIDAARQRLLYLQSPLAVHRIKRWLLREGPRVLFILAVMLVLWGTARFAIGRLAWALASRRGRHSAGDQQERAETLKRVARNFASIVIVGAGGVAILQQFGVDLTVLLGGAAVVGMAIAFGAQNLVRDYFYGFLILVENQYRVGNVVRIAGVAGVVEDISLRITTLRDLQGIAHFIPHSQITTVSNLTHGWSRAVLEIPVAYKEDADQIMLLLMSVVETMQKDPEYQNLMLGEPEMLGVDDFADSAVTIKLLVKTLPHKQWRVRRELLRRIKQSFDQQGVEIPFPQRTLHLRSDDAALPQPDFAQRDGR